jgi:hypothetical protein
MNPDVWTYRETSTLGSNVLEANADIVGYDVEALDGSIGHVDEATYESGASYVVVDTGPWIFGKKVMLPAGVIRAVDPDEEKVFVNRTKDEIKNAPELEESIGSDDAYRDELSAYYGPGGQAHRDDAAISAWDAGGRPASTGLPQLDSVRRLIGRHAHPGRGLDRRLAPDEQDLARDREQRPRDRDGEEGAEDAGELGADEHRT